MFILDAHQDIAFNYITHNREYTLSAWEKRRREVGSGKGLATLGLPDSILGRVAIVFATLFVAPRPNRGTSPYPTYSTPREAYDQAMQQMDYYQRLADENEKIHLILRQSDLDMVLTTWESGTEITDRKQGFVILMEGADPILEPQQFEEWYERGVRLVGPAWQATRYAGGTGMPGGLTALGQELLEVLADNNAILDLSHLAEEAFLQAVDEFGGILLASHSNPRKFVDTDRHLSDDMIRRLAERDGVMGIVLYNRFLSEDWTSGSAKSTVPFSRIIEAIDHVCQVTGSANHVGIGSDFDGGFGAESIPEDMETATDLWLLYHALRKRGYENQHIEAILSGNMLRKLRASLPE